MRGNRMTPGQGWLTVAAIGLSSTLLVGGPTIIEAQAPAGATGNADLVRVLDQLDAASTRFQNAQAEFAWDQYTAVVQSHDVQRGTIAFRRGSKSTAMVAHILTDNDQPSPKDVLFRDGEVRLYQAAIKQETILAAGANRQQYESYSTLGFGSSGRELTANWNISYAGTEKIGTVDTAKLDLTFKHPSPNSMFTHIMIWIDPVHSTSLRQQFFEPSGDVRTATYTGIRLNNASDGMFELKVPKGTTVIRK